MKFVLKIDPKTLKDESFPYLEPGRVPPIVDPEKPDEAKDGGVTGPAEENPRKPKPS